MYIIKQPRKAHSFAVRYKALVLLTLIGQYLCATYAQPHTGPITHKPVAMKPIIIQTQQTFQKAIHSQTPVLVIFYKIGCPYCKAIQPIIREVAKALSPHTKVYVMQVSATNKETYKNLYDFQAFPRCAVFQSGTMKGLLNIQSEQLTISTLLAWVKKYRPSLSSKSKP